MHGINNALLTAFFVAVILVSQNSRGKEYDAAEVADLAKTVEWAATRIGLIDLPLCVAGIGKVDESTPKRQLLRTYLQIDECPDGRDLLRNRDHLKDWLAALVYQSEELDVSVASRFQVQCDSIAERLDKVADAADRLSEFSAKHGFDSAFDAIRAKGARLYRIAVETMSQATQVMVECEKFLENE